GRVERRGVARRGRGARLGGVAELVGGVELLESRRPVQLGEVVAQVVAPRRVLIGRACAGGGELAERVVAEVVREGAEFAAGVGAGMFAGEESGVVEVITE